MAQATSILAVDFGNIYTRGVLIDQVDGIYRLIAQAQARTTTGFPAGDASIGLMRVTQQMTALTGRRLMRPDGALITPEQQDRSGVDLFVATASIGRPLRTILIGLVPDLSIASGLRAASGTYVQLVDTITMDDNRSAQDQMNAIILARPELIFITGGTEDGATDPVLEIARVVRLACTLMPQSVRPMILYAGNSALVPQIEEMFSDVELFVAENVRPSVEGERLEPAQAQFGTAFDSVSEGRIGGFERVGQMSRLGVLPTAQSYNLMADYLGRVGGSVMIVDIGATVSTLSVSLEHGSGRRGAHRHVATSIRTDIGLGHSADDLVKAVGIDAVRQWLPFNATDNEILAYALNKTLRPYTIPETPRALYLEHALLRAGLRELLLSARPAWTPDTAIDDVTAPLPSFAQIIAAGSGLTGTGQPGLAAMLLLDALQPIGVTKLRLDPNGILPALGALARVNPQAVVQVLDEGVPELLCTAVSVSGSPRLNTPAVRVRITNSDGATENHIVDGGTLWVYPLVGKVDVRLTVVGRGLHIGGKRGLRFGSESGLGAIVIDARGRPLPLALDARGLAGQIPQWYAQATGEDVRAIPDEWLTVERPAPVEAPARPQRGATAKKDEALVELAETPKRGRRGKKQQPTPEPVTAQNEDDIDDLRNLLS